MIFTRFAYFSPIAFYFKPFRYMGFIGYKAVNNVCIFNTITRIYICIYKRAKPFIHSKHLYLSYFFIVLTILEMYALYSLLPKDVLISLLVTFT